MSTHHHYEHAESALVQNAPVAVLHDSGAHSNSHYHQMRQSGHAGSSGESHYSAAKVHSGGIDFAASPAENPVANALSSEQLHYLGITPQEYKNLDPANKALAAKEYQLGRTGLTPEEEADLRSSVDYQGNSPLQQRLRAEDRQSILWNAGKAPKLTDKQQAELDENF